MDGDRPRLQLGGARREKVGSRVAKNFGGAVSSFDTPGLGYMASEDEEVPEKTSDLEPSEGDLHRQRQQDFSLENCLKKVHAAGTAILGKEWIQPNQVGFFEPEDEQIDKPKDQPPNPRRHLSLTLRKRQKRTFAGRPSGLGAY